MRSFSELYDIVEKELSDLYYPSTPKHLYDSIKYVLNIGGKRIRPILMLLSHQLFSDDIEKSIKAALGIEVFHNFTLLHDDIMDEAPLRRGLQTAHEKWDNNTAILSGDTMLVQAFHLISQVENKNLRKVLEVFNKASTEVCEGQKWDMNFEERKDVTLSEYLKQGKLDVKVLGRGTVWLDTGTFSSLMQANQYVQVIEERQGRKIGCIEEAAYRMGFIDDQKLLELAEPFRKSGYGEYLINIVNS